MSNAANILTESVISLAQAARELPSLRAGRPVHPTCVWRWSKYGVKTPVGRIRLETTSVAGRVATSREAVRRFLIAVAAAKAGINPAADSLRPESQSHADAKRKLDALNNN
jgi:hypothetical protein